jgi:hypothetical protein
MIYICYIKSINDMKKLIIIRIGNRPDPRVTLALASHIHGKAIVFAIPGSVVSVFMSESTPEAVHESVKPTGHFFFVGEEGDKFMTNFPREIQAVIDREFGEAPRTQPAPELSLDDLLSLVSANGLESLTTAQRTRLEELSR